MIQALWHVSEQQSQLQTVVLPPEYDCQIETYYSLVSTGTERLVASGKVPQALQASMGVPYMEGSFPFPVKYGYSLVGKVSTPGHPFAGQFVHCMHPHQTICGLKTRDLHLVPEGIPPDRACLASNLETAVNAVWDSKVSIGDRVVIVGFGMIGALIARILSDFPGIEIWVAEQQEERKQIAQQRALKVVDSETPAFFDIAFHTSHSSTGLQQSVDLLAKEGTVVELSWYGETTVAINLGYSFHYDRKKIISSQVSQIPSHKQNRWDYRRRKELVFELLQNPAFDEHISHYIPFEESPAFFDQLRKGTVVGMGYCFDYKK